MKRPRTAVIVILVLAVSAGAMLWSFDTHATTLTACGGGAPGNTPLGSAMAIGTPTEETHGLDHWYNFSVASGGGGRELDTLTFQVLTATGMNVTPGPGWMMSVLNYRGESIGSYVLTGPTAGTWSAGGTQPLLSQEVISLLTQPEKVSGDLMVVSVAPPWGACPNPAGSIIVNIP
jgi:hypothetical protein